MRAMHSILARASNHRAREWRQFWHVTAAYAAAAAPNSLRAFRCDIGAFDDWCRAHAHRTLPASPSIVAGFLEARAGQGAAAASLTRYRASIAKLHRLCHLPDPCQDELVKLTDLPPEGPAVITRVCQFDMTAASPVQARRAWSPQPAQTPGALELACGCRVTNAA